LLKSLRTEGQAEAIRMRYALDGGKVPSFRKMGKALNRKPENAFLSVRAALKRMREVANEPEPIEKLKNMLGLDNETSDDRVMEAVNSLSKRQGEVIKKRFGLDGGKPMTLAQDGRTFGSQRTSSHGVLGMKNVKNMLENDSENFNKRLCKLIGITPEQYKEHSGKLSKNQTLILELRAQNKTLTQIADELGITHAAVVSRNIRAKQRLTQLAKTEKSAKTTTD
jgi:DNA-directed RNA polymerase sigma subunit (sigma70/sigma32)